ncbi:MAG: hypothetical protein KGM49_07390 [Sphingomonadales bacterium]|nr:hypothetical protein [Sphingomonadales bacterium]
MRSVALIGLLVLAGCDKAAPTPQPSATAEAVAATTAEPRAAATPAPPPPVPTPTPTPKPATAAKPEKHMQAVGTEPFWSVDVMPKGRLRYSTPGMVNGVVVSSVEKHQGKVTRYVARLNRRPFVLELTPIECSDGMSDATYPFTATLVHSGRTDRGCARMK